MIILRKKLFSKMEDDDKETAKGAGLIAGSVAVGKGGKILGDKVSEKSAKFLMNSELTAKDKEAVKEKLREKAKKQGIKIIDDPNFENSAYTGSKIGKHIKNGLAKLIKAVRKSGNKEAEKNIKEALDNKRIENATGSKHLWNSIGKDRILMGKGTLADTDILSHEIGHAQYERPDRSKSIIGKAAHKLAPLSKTVMGDEKMGKVGRGAMFAHGFQAGVKKEKNKREGKKTNAWDKTRSVAVPAAIVAPVLITEGKASMNGLKSMKKLGASKELIKQSRKRLGAAYGTYAGETSKAVFMGGSGELAGRGASKIMHSTNKEKKDNKKNK